MKVGRVERAIGYYRISKMGNGDWDRQHSKDYYPRLITEFCVTNGYELIGLYGDLDYTGRNFNRPEWNRAVEDDIDLWDIMVTPDFTRIGRNLLGSKTKITQVTGLGKRILSISEPYDINEVSGKLICDIMLAVAEADSDRTGERLRAMHRQIALEGRWRGGCPPTGFRYADPENGDYSFVVIPEEADLVRRIYEMRLSGHSHNSIAMVLRREGYRGKQGGLITIQQVKDKLYSPVFIGKRYVDGELRDAGLPPIVDAETWNAVQALRVVRKHAKPGVYLLSGLLVCSKCGSVLYRQQRRKRNRVDWVCSSSLRGIQKCAISIPEKTVEPEVIATFLKYIDGNEYSKALEKQAAEIKTSDLKLREAKRRLSNIERKQRLLFETYSEGDISKAMFQKMNSEFDKQTADLADTVENLDASIRLSKGAMSDFTLAWDRLDVQARKTALGLFIDRIEVVPFESQDKSRLNFIWRF